MSKTKQIPQNYVTGLEGGGEFLADIIELSSRIKAEPERFAAMAPLAHRIYAAMFVNPSLRTRTSFESGMARLGGHMITLAPGAGAWGIEFEKGVVMDGGKAEHIIEAAGVMSSYAHVIGLRAFGRMDDFEQDSRDDSVHNLAEFSTVPVINMESAIWHPCQGMADSLTLHELFGGETKGKRFALTWATHPKMTGMAVPHSAMLAAARMGMDVTVAHPPGYELYEPVVEQAEKLSAATGGSVAFTNDMDAACEGANVIYGKAWGSRLDYGNTANGSKRNASFGDWTVGRRHLEASDRASFMHCLPIRRNVVATDYVLDSEASVVQQQAANRMWTQMALLLRLLHADV